MIVVSPARGDGVTVSGTVVLQNATYRDTDYFGQAGITLASNGTATGFDSATVGPLSYSWLTSGSASDFEVYCQVNSGSIDGNKNSWLSLSSNRTWSLKWWNSSGQITLSIRNATTQLQLAAAVIILDNN